MADETSSPNTIELATELTIAWLSNPNTRATSDEVPAFLARMHDAVRQLGHPVDETPTEEFTPATSVRRSLASRDHIISMIDGKPYKTLRRHIATHGLTPEQYRERYKLKSDYPMVAPTYSEARRSMAQKIGLGRKAASPAAPAGDKSGAAKSARGRKSAAAAHIENQTPASKAPARRGRKPAATTAPAAAENAAPAARVRRRRKAAAVAADNQPTMVKTPRRGSRKAQAAPVE